jgi:hypothetical protein
MELATVCGHVRWTVFSPNPYTVGSSIKILAAIGQQLLIERSLKERSLG